MKVDIVFILGPSEQMYPLTAPKFSLPFLNVPLLTLSIRYLAPVASKIFIACLEEHHTDILRIVKDCRIPIEFVQTASYEGMSYVLGIIGKKISTPYFIMSKGDIYGQEPIRPLLEGFIMTGDDLYIKVEKSTSDNKIMCIDQQNRLVGFDDEEIPFIKNSKIRVTTEFVMKDFFIIKKSSILDLEDSLYGFKNNVIPHLIQDDKIVRLGENTIFQVLKFTDYIKQIHFKNTMLGCTDGTEYNLINADCEIDESNSVHNSIIGSNVKIGINAVIKESIIMDNAEISDKARYHRCILDSSNQTYKF